jgi:DNA-binding NtrC family response regulator
VRVLSATNRPLMERIASKDFREDLYYRLNVIHIAVPPLRQRREDIPGLFQYFLEAYAAERGMTRPRIVPETLEQLVRYDWRGNVRELKSVAERLMPPDGLEVLMPEDLPIEIRQWPVGMAAAAPARSALASRADGCFERMIGGHESFWTVVHPAFMSRDLTRDDVRGLVGSGLQRTRGSYKLLVELFNMPPPDYKRFLNFLRKHDCQVAFQRYRAFSNASSTLPGRRPNAP